VAPEHSTPSHGAWVVAALLIGVAVSLVLGVVGNFRVGAYALAALLGLAALARLTLPIRLAGPLAVRSRVVDTLVATVMAVALVVLAEGVPLR
jgi:hypothetical protein